MNCEILGNSSAPIAKACTINNTKLSITNSNTDCQYGQNFNESYAFCMIPRMV